MQNLEKKEPITLELTDRQYLWLTGVQNVDVFDEEKIVLQTELGKLEIQGQQLNVTNLDVEYGKLQVDGRINSIAYPEEKKKMKHSSRKKRGFFSRLHS